ncbi:host attachment protein [Halomonas ventosae]|uniref:Protein required for attachment to host cells n=1 Tax=Halomonas ventosae TaxID=229007 RepID=A0A2T0VSA1_9GAMM|nr:host attachment protein [Halomonas ventosae]PRY73382.1 protein required for attachment to host cells [Halomonas ventosae]
MDTIWVVVADQARARLFSASGSRGPLEEVEDLANPEGRLHDQDLNADSPGRAFDTMGEGRHAMGKHHSPKEQEAIRFAHEVGERLAAGLHDGAYRHLIISATPRFLGLLRETLPEAVAKRVVLELHKDLTALGRDEIRAHLPERLPRAPRSPEG